MNRCAHRSLAAAERFFIPILSTHLGAAHGGSLWRKEMCRRIEPSVRMSESLNVFLVCWGSGLEKIEEPGSGFLQAAFLRLNLEFQLPVWAIFAVRSICRLLRKLEEVEENEVRTPLFLKKTFLKEREKRDWERERVVANAQKRKGG